MVPSTTGRRGALRLGVELALSRGHRALLLAVAAAALLCLAEANVKAASLPDGRAYELVSPPLKNGGEIMPDSQRTRAAADGSALGFGSLSGFEDVREIAASTDYVSVRTGSVGTNGWSTHAIAPPQAAMVFVADEHGMEPLYWGEFSDDISRGVFRSWSPVTNAPMVASEQNLYVRDDLRTPGNGAYQLLTDCPACSTPFPEITDPLLLKEESYPAGASEDFEHVIFESRLPLVADSTADPNAPTWNLFEWDHGAVRLVGVLPDGRPAPVSQAGQGAKEKRYTPHTISSDGSRIFFTVPRAACSDGSFNCGDLYLRVNHVATVHLNASEKTNGTGPGGTDANGPQVAQYWDASSDGSRAFFTTTESLTNDAPSGIRNLYMYSVQPDAQGHHLTFLSVDNRPGDSGSDDVLAVVGVSDDGHTVYFVNGGGQLVPNAPTQISGVPYKLFRWHDSTIEYVGGIADSDLRQDANTNFDGTPKQARISPDGRYLLFSADRGTGLTGYNHGSCPGNGTPNGTCRELYLYRAGQTPPLVCVSCNPSGAKGTADAMDVVRLATGAAAVTYHLNHPMTDDGQHVFFSTGEALLPEDINGKIDVYEYDVGTGALHLLSTGTDTSDSYFMDASRNGSDVFILTRQRLVGWDIDGSYDLYDVRSGGGFPEPVGQVVCGPDTCRGSASAAPGRMALGTLTTSGSNVKSSPKGKRAPARHRCKHGFVRKRVHRRLHCVKARKHKARRAARHRSGR